MKTIKIRFPVWCIKIKYLFLQPHKNHTTTTKTHTPSNRIVYEKGSEPLYHSFHRVGHNLKANKITDRYNNCHTVHTHTYTATSRQYSRSNPASIWGEILCNLDFFQFFMYDIGDFSYTFPTQAKTTENNVDLKVFGDDFASWASHVNSTRFWFKLKTILCIMKSTLSSVDFIHQCSGIEMKFILK